MTPEEKPDFEGILKSLLKGRSPEEEEKAEAARKEAERWMVKQAISWLEEKWGGEDESSPCPYCGHNTYSVEPPINVHPLGRPNMVKTYFPVSCANCGQTTMLDAGVVGVFDAISKSHKDEDN